MSSVNRVYEHVLGLQAPNPTVAVRCSAQIQLV
jgi:hypothetical protein